ncbi:hypothetical protein F8M41_000553 [Gigaspora margarita]|uniref:Hydrophobin n=1 Tax=Gigaspora margarita TaxID=4874 RepID=A0A8H4AZH0_GIGMA|nr:hypothetical protein F8M41_000553 [Gigaspora margarita]
MKYNFSTFTISIIFGILFLTLISSTQRACSVGLGKGDCQAGDVCVTAADCAEANSLCKIGLGIIHCITKLSDGCLVAGFAGVIVVLTFEIVNQKSVAKKNAQINVSAIDCANHHLSLLNTCKLLIVNMY